MSSHVKPDKSSDRLRWVNIGLIKPIKTMNSSVNAVSVIAVETIKLILQLEALDPEWDENKINRNAKGQFAKNSSSSSKSVRQKESTDLKNSYDVVAISQQINSSMQYVMQQLEVKKRMTEKVFASFQKRMNASIRHATEMLQDVEKKVDKQVQVKEEVLKDWCDRLKEKFLNTRAATLRSTQTIVETMDEALESPEVQLSVVAAVGLIAFMLLRHLSPILQLMFLYVLFTHLGEFLRQEAFSVTQKENQKNNNTQLSSAISLANKNFNNKESQIKEVQEVSEQAQKLLPSDSKEKLDTIAKLMAAVSD